MMDELKCKEIILNSIIKAASIQSTGDAAKIYICKLLVMAVNNIPNFTWFKGYLFE